MVTRTVKDAEGRTWTCTTNAKRRRCRHEGEGRAAQLHHRVDRAPVLVTVGWSWEKTSENGLARMIVAAAKAA